MFENNLTDCKCCRLHASAKTVGVNYRGAENPHIMFVGIGPGPEEDEHGINFYGRTGRLLEDCISKAGVRQEYCAWDNVVKCFPNDFGQIRNPSKEERWSCAPYLFRNIEKHDPKVIIPLGNIALFALTGLKGITKYRGQRFIRRIGSKDRVIVPSFHPASALRGQAGNKDFITQDILHAWRIANAHPSQPPSLFPPS
jgi:DNA polymerase